ncbi:helix-turn-helix domain-containing protein [Pseudomonas laurylsulfatiphila]|uniref:helix-turn-helix domain-containing protein n=1 Tax=Pseudomonas laurylsulfatiphila TaxID=2011015 RepID=UPI00215DFBD1|nr:helix-turn-helix transcriptional regulator [Pseudomonas laurylsulfatiphila]UVM06402.1 helix-turn-helix domain-containing protein [Pseudomonas laurylsulfatiphila]
MTIGARLREERTRLGVSQTELAVACGIAKNTQLNYEKDERSPDAKYLSAAEALGMDVYYVLVGKHFPVSPDQLSPFEIEMLSYLKDLSDYDKETLRRMAAAMAVVGKSSVPETSL